MIPLWPRLRRGPPASRRHREVRVGSRSDRRFSTTTRSIARPPGSPRLIGDSPAARSLGWARADPTPGRRLRPRSRRMNLHCGRATVPTRRSCQESIVCTLGHDGPAAAGSVCMTSRSCRSPTQLHAVSLHGHAVTEPRPRATRVPKGHVVLIWQESRSQTRGSGRSGGRENRNDPGETGVVESEAE